MQAPKKAEQSDIKRLIKLLLDQPWHKRCEIIVDYVPPHARQPYKPIVVIRYGNSFLRYSKGPKQGFFWDCYGDDMQDLELAVMALSQAQVPLRLVST